MAFSGALVNSGAPDRKVRSGRLVGFLEPSKCLQACNSEELDSNFGCDVCKHHYKCAVAVPSAHGHITQVGARIYGEAKIWKRAKPSSS